MEPIYAEKPFPYAPCYLLNFPYELTFQIVSFMDAKTIVMTALTSRDLHSFMETHEYEVWKPLCESICPSFSTLCKSIKASVSFKLFYIQRSKWMDKVLSNQLDFSNRRWVSSKETGLDATTGEDLSIEGGNTIRTLMPWSEFTVFPAREKDPQVCYFEIRVLNGGKEGLLGIGIGDQETPVNTIPGWNRGGNTCGYHADNGLKYWKMGSGHAYAEPYDSGDVIGCGYDISSKCTFFTKNGTYLGVAFTDFPNLPYYPMCGSLEACEMSFNLGSEPFLFDVDTFYLIKQTDFSSPTRR